MRTLTLLLCLASFGQCAYGKECAERDGYAAEVVTDYLDSWQNVAQFYKQFQDCDDGGVAEGVSDAVARLLANHWNRLQDLLKRTSVDAAFEAFVVKHLDETDNGNDLRQIALLAKSKCPVGASELCKKLSSRIDSLGPQP
jgi:hypothetical protein